MPTRFCIENWFRALKSLEVKVVTRVASPSRDGPLDGPDLVKPPKIRVWGLERFSGYDRCELRIVPRWRSKHKLYTSTTKCGTSALYLGIYGLTVC